MQYNRSYLEPVEALVADGKLLLQQYTRTHLEPVEALVADGKLLLQCCRGLGVAKAHALQRKGRGGVTCGEEGAVQCS